MGPRVWLDERVKPSPWLQFDSLIQLLKSALSLNSEDEKKYCCHTAWRLKLDYSDGLQIRTQ